MTETKKDLRELAEGGAESADAGRLVLVVDDEEAMCDSCRQVLMREGLEVEGVPSGKAALEFMGRRLPDVLFVDLKMPGMSGMEFLEKAREVDPLIVAVVITGYATLSSAVDAMKGGAYDFLPKPFKAEELRIVTRRALEKRRLALVASNAEREKTRMRDLFVAMVSHQLKSPLASLKECLDAATSSFTDEMPDACLELVGRAARRAAHLLSLMNDWLTLARMEAASMSSKTDEVNLCEVVREAVSHARRNLQWHDVDIQVKIPEGAVSVHGDAEALRELFVNLVDNAIRYTPDGGKVSVKLEEEPGGAAVMVSDTGCGIPERELALIFERFYRGRQARKTDGTGLGLAIARQIVEAHGGHIRAESEAGCGTTFRVYLPTGAGEE